MQLPRRQLGRTGLEVSLLGMGGFHQVEVDQETIDRVLDRFIESGGNYVETARSYGGGASEKKLGRAIARHAHKPVLASKTSARDEEGAWREINTSLEHLGVPCIDLYFFHGVGDEAQLDAIAGPSGALRAFERARDQRMIRHMAVSSHWPLLYIEAARRLPVDVALIWGNYLDFCNYPEIPREVIPALRARGMGILFMKPLADGYLYRSPHTAFRYALAQDADCLVAGFNSLDMLEADLAVCCEQREPPRPGETEEILAQAIELGRYVCRQCAECTVGPESERIRRVFELEGKYDRQMDDRLPTDAAHYALRERLKGWFHQTERAQALYDAMGAPGDRLAQGRLEACRHGIDVPRKLGIAHAKLARNARVEEI